MLKSLQISQFTAFREAELTLSDGLNVIVGDNGTGKTHLLKLAYLFGSAWSDLQSKRLRVNVQSAETYLAERLAGLFRVSDLSALIRQGHKNGARLQAEISGEIPPIRIHMASEPAPTTRLPERMP